MEGWRKFYEDIELTPEEIDEAIFEGKKKKYFHGNNKEYWQRQEGIKAQDANPINNKRVRQSGSNQYTTSDRKTKGYKGDIFPDVQGLKKDGSES